MRIICGILSIYFFYEFIKFSKYDLTVFIPMINFYLFTRVDNFYFIYFLLKLINFSGALQTDLKGCYYLNYFK